MGLYDLKNRKTVTVQKLNEEIMDLYEDLTIRGKRGLMKDVKEYMSQSVALRFAESKGPGGVSWAPLVARTGKPLVDTGGLMEAATSESGFLIGDNFVEHTVRHPTAVIHQFGVQEEIEPDGMALWWPGAEHPVNHTVGIPARPFMGFDLKDMDAILGLTMDWYNKATGRQ